jgi:hypothetical protein
MLTLRHIAAPIRTAVLFVLLSAVVASGIPRVEIHANEDASHGHDHGGLAHGHGVATKHQESASDEDAELPGSSHVHDLSAPAAAPLQNAFVDTVEMPPSHMAMPSILRPPDRIITPFRRPPKV